MKNLFKFLILSIVLFSFSCRTMKTQKVQTTSTVGDNVSAEAFADIQVLRYDIPMWETLSSQQKELAFYLYQAALCGRDIIYDQKSKYGLMVRKTIDNIYGTYNGDRKNAEWKKFEDYCGRFWFSNGFYHHYGNEKFVPECSYDYFVKIAKASDIKAFPTDANENIDQYLAKLNKIMFDINFEPKCVNLDPGVDNIALSSNNFYENVSQKEVENYYDKFPTAGNAPSWGLNSKLEKVNGKIVEKVWKSGGMYGAAIDQIIFWLQKAVPVAENDHQKTTLQKLIKFYQTGDLKDFDDYSIAWVSDTSSSIDVVNGFIEVYLDAIGKKGSFESVVSFKDMEETKRLKAIAAEAQWFEDHSPLIESHKKKQVKGITAKAITVIAESGDAAPSTPIGINLPNADWIRKEYGSKSVALTNIIHSYNVFSGKGKMLQEFVIDSAELNRAKMYGALASDLHTDMHECIGHASGQINPGVETTDKTLKNYASCLEEARADLVGLYYINDPKLIELGVMPNMDVAKAEYDAYIRNALITQMTRIQLGNNLEEAHMRNRQLNAMWAYEKGKKDNVIEFYKVNNKTYVKINDYNKLRTLFGELLREIQRVKSEGDFEAGKNLVENFGVKLNPTLHKEILARYALLNEKPYRGFVQPQLSANMKDGRAENIKVSYPISFFEQMMNYGKNYSFLPIHN